MSDVAEAVAEVKEALEGAEGLLDFLADIGQDDDLVAANAIIAAARRWVRMVSEGESVWLCREGDRMTDWAHGPENEPHCWFNGAKAHNPECGEYLMVADE